MTQRCRSSVKIGNYNLDAARVKEIRGIRSVKLFYVCVIQPCFVLIVLSNGTANWKTSITVFLQEDILRILFNTMSYKCKLFFTDRTCELIFLTISVKKPYLLDGRSPTIIRSKKIAHKKPNVLLPTWNKLSPWRSTRGSKVTVSRYPVLHKSKFSGDTTKVGHTDCD